MRGRVLVVDDERAMCDLIADDLGRRGFEIVASTSPESALRQLREGDLDAVVADLAMPGIDGIELCRRAVAGWPGLPVIILTAFGSLETATSAIRAGAYDFVTKPVEMDLLAIAVERAVQHRRLQRQVSVLSDEIARAQRPGALLGESEAMHRLRDQTGRLADSEVTVLITGESGTGKELVARALHEGSRRRSGPLVSINCAALPETLLESELFGHARGAYTGAQGARQGLFLKADGGTLYLDEVGELPTALQPKLLRSLEERRVRPVGSDREVPFDARILAATNRDLEKLVEAGRLRRDLYYRINVVELEVPPLRDRGNDVLLLARHFLAELATRADRPLVGLSAPAAERLLAYGWPGNVRELRNVMERALALTRHQRLALSDLPEKIRRPEPPPSAAVHGGPEELLPLAEVERRYIVQALELLGGNRTQTARVLGCDRKTLYRKLRSYGLGDDDRTE